MRTMRTWLPVLGVALAALVFSQIPNLTAAPKKSPGGEAYQPTKQEWLALRMQAYYGDTNMYDDGIAVTF